MLFWFSALFAGVSLCCVLLMVAQPWAQNRHDARAPGIKQRFGVLWPWVYVLSMLLKPLMTWGMRQRLAHWLAQAGADDACQPEHIAALRLLAFLFGVVAAFFVGAVLLQLSIDTAVPSAVVTGALLSMLPVHRLKRRAAQRQIDMLREFPFLLDMTTLCVEAGLNLQGALLQAAEHGPQGDLNSELRRALADMRAGMPRMAALKSFAQRTGLSAVAQWVMAMDQADQMGMSLGPILRAQSEQRRNERFLRAEKLALQAPVKMLFPMVICIFPCTFLVIGFPIAVKLFDAGL